MLPEELIIGGLPLLLIVIVALFTYTLLLESCYFAAKKQRLDWVKNWIKPLQILVSILPLIGLLGTIMGLLETFNAIAVASEGALTAGIGKSLFSTQAGLLMAIPGILLLFIIRHLVEKADAS